MANVRLQFLGCGDAFGSGGRLNTCFLVEAGSERFLIDCGTTVLIGMRRFGVDPNGIGLILLSHLHGDHFGGLPIFLLDAGHPSKRRDPLTIAGPPGTRERLERAMEALYPNSSKTAWAFELVVVELEPERERRLGGVTVTPYEVVHPSGAPSLALRIGCDGRTIAFSGDTEWTEALIPAARGADLFLAECYTYERKVKGHTDLKTLAAHLDEIAAKRVVLTHMSAEMLERPDVGFERAEDGGVIEL
jgi:ribonuclease BN (tRNA processing enzyme)